MVVKLEIQVPSVAFTYEKSKLKAVLRAAGSEIASLTRSLLRNSRGSGKRGASLPGQPPALLSGTLASSIRSKLTRNGEGVRVRDMAFYALFLEKGANGPGKRVLASRPFLTTVLEQDASSIEARIKTAVMAGIKFERRRSLK